MDVSGSPAPRSTGDAPVPLNLWQRAFPREQLGVTLRATVIGGAVILTVWALSEVVLLAFLAVLIGVMLRGLADGLTRLTRLPTWITLTVVSLALVMLIGGLGWWTGPRFAKEAEQLWGDVSGQLQNLQQRYGGLLGGGGGGGGQSGGGSSLAHLAPTVATSTLGFITGLLVVVVTALYFAIAPNFYRDGVVRLFPMRYRPRAREVLTEIGHTLKWWLLGQAIDMAVVGVLAGVGLMLLGVPLWLALAVLAGLLTFVPYFGPIVSAIPAVIVAGTMGWSTVLWVVAIYLACHGVEGYLVAPYVQRRTVDLPPALTVFSMTIMAALFGMLGLIVATPMLAAVLVVVRKVYIHDVLGDPGGDPAAEVGPNKE